MSLRLVSKFSSKVSQFLRCSSTKAIGVMSNDIENPNEINFEKLLMESKLINFGRPDNKCVVGKIISRCNDDLYVDYGAKHEAVVKIPVHQSVLKELEHVKTEEYYKEGDLVRLILRSYEMTGLFLGDTTHITICESDAILLGPYLKGVNKFK
ncbi:small ribosomal subunit protein bS1m isoform X1 [Hydra vulgaris]|uniref:28S ribosomal protein S28,mitochondrial n=1 Tax=Hydra vulgaris TaxID=6087 RepID=T2M2V5_HYDVU|nr:28S ribosomal protein S28, mitochondrial-like [Hydra vulgaris]